ncbi:uncharacterized protein LOC132285592 [Cornus florida]|uniref:uncharacterized protein LOC132285592 n=1 Tax=Cornus florida TaxID=4283 RepID=UPI0028A0C701|nr:uncharacterized protein LOC132285592 [Cornus florida]
MVMERPTLKSSASNGKDSDNGGGGGGGVQKKRKLPTPKELIAHYESQGMKNEEASVKVIDDLQKALFRVVTMSTPPREAKEKSTSMAETSKKLDVINSRLVRLDMKMDAKPGYGEALAIGVASGAVLRGIGAVFPHVVGAVSHIWNSVRNITNSTTTNN